MWQGPKRTIGGRLSYTARRSGLAHPRALYASLSAATYASQHGDPSEAVDLISASGALRERLTQHQMSASVSPTDLNNLGFALWLTGDYTEARTLYDMALAAGGTEPTTLNNIGMIEERLGRYDEAVDYYQRTLELLRPSSLSLRARVLNNLGVSLSLAGEPQVGRQRLMEALEIRRKLQGSEGPDYAVTLRNLGLAAQQEGRLAEAERLLEEGRDLLARKQGSRSTEYARTMHLLGELLARRGNDEGALAALQTALDIRGAALGREHPETVRHAARPRNCPTAQWPGD